MPDGFRERTAAPLEIVEQLSHGRRLIARGGPDPVDAPARHFALASHFDVEERVFERRRTAVYRENSHRPAGVESTPSGSADRLSSPSPGPIRVHFEITHEFDIPLDALE